MEVVARARLFPLRLIATLAATGLLLANCGGYNEPTDRDGATTSLVTASETAPTPLSTSDGVESPGFGSPTPASNEAMRVSGSAWLNARPAAELVEAIIGSTVCASTKAGEIFDDRIAWYGFEIPSAADQDGCGQPGAVVYFRVAGITANESLLWQPGSGTGAFDLTAGPQFARYRGTFTAAAPLPRDADVTVQPIIDGAVCGIQINRLQGSGPDYIYDVVVDPTTLAVGCGRDGATVTFRVVAVDETGITPLRELPRQELWAPGEIIDDIEGP